MRIKDLVVRERPRERLAAFGPTSLSEAELLAILLRVGKKGENAVAQAARLLTQYGLEGLSQAPVTELRTTMGLVKASQIVAAFELSRRVKHAAKPTVIRDAADASAYCSPIIGHLEQEHFLVVWLDVRNQVIGHEIVTKGLVDSSLVHPREVFRGAIRANAHAIVVAHNHPSGDKELSEEDEKVTGLLNESGMLLGVEVLDHIVVTKNR